MENTNGGVKHIVTATSMTHVPFASVKVPLSIDQEILAALQRIEQRLSTDDGVKELLQQIADNTREPGTKRKGSK